MRTVEKWPIQWQEPVVRVGTSLLLLYFYCGVYLPFEFSAELLRILGLNVFLLEAVGVIGGLAAVLFLLNVLTPFSAFAMLASFQLTLFNFPVFKDVQAPYLSAILVVFSLFHRREGKGYSFFGGVLDDAQCWRLPLFLAVYLGFSITGVSKLFYPPWIEGVVLSEYCGRGTFAGFFGDMGCTLISSPVVAYWVLAVECFSFPLAIWKKTRLFIWSMNIVLHIGSFLFMPLPPVSLCVFLLQALLFDPAWIQPLTKLPEGLQRPVAD